MTLIDTSAWIDFFRGKEPLATQVEKLLEENQVATCGPILTELGRGFRSEKEKQKVLGLFSGCRHLAQPIDLWEAAGEIGFALKRAGSTVKSFDLLIAAYAISHQTPLLSTDKDFKLIQKRFPQLQLLP